MEKRVQGVGKSAALPSLHLKKSKNMGHKNTFQPLNIHAISAKADERNVGAKSMRADTGITEVDGKSLKVEFGTSF